MVCSGEHRQLATICAVYVAPNDPFCWGPGIRENYIIHYVKSGRGYFVCDGRTYALSQGQCFVIFPGSLIAYYPHPDDPWEYAWIDFNGIQAKSLLEQSSLSIQNPVTAPISADTARLFETAAATYSKQTAADLCRSAGYLLLILADILRDNPGQNTKQPVSRILHHAVERIDSDYRKPELSIDTLARDLSVNRTSLYRHFMEELGMSPKSYITQVRMEKAIHLLKSGEYSIKAISYSVGFSDPLYFSKVFKKYTGLSPRSYRNTDAP